MSVSDEQVQELMDSIIDKSESMRLDVERIIDCLGRVMLSATSVHGAPSAIVEIEAFGKC
jgi:hypothetical protein